MKPIVTAMPIESEVNMMELSNLVTLGREIAFGEFGEMYNKVINAPSIVSEEQSQIEQVK